MSKSTREDGNNKSNLDSSDSSYDEDDDFITFQYESRPINIYYSRLSKYSRLICKEYLFSDVQNRFPQELSTFQKQNKIDTENIYLYFQLLQKKFVINQTLSFKQYSDLFKISSFLQTSKISKKLTNFFKSRQADADFLIQIILIELDNQSNSTNFQLNIEIEESLSAKINDCFLNEKFLKVPIQLIYRIVDKSDKKQLSADLMYDFIKKNLKTYSILLEFLDIKNLSDEKFNDLYEHFSNNSNKHYLIYLKCNLDYIKECKNKLKINENEKNQLQIKLNESKQTISDLLKNKNRLEQEKELLQKRIDEVEKGKNEFQEKLEKEKLVNEKLEKEKNEFQEKLKTEKLINEKLEKEKNELKEKLERCSITGVINAKIKSGLLFNAEIKLKGNLSHLNTERSKYIVSSSNSLALGEKAYENGEPITSLNFTSIDFGGKAGTYYVRSFIADIDGKSTELVSNQVTTSGSTLSFDYERMAKQIILPKGQYKLEVWGAQGGNSSGSRQSSVPGQGGKGGYSRGNLTLEKNTKLFIYVGEQGKSADPNENAKTEGAFPDGGGTMTGHNSDEYTSVPGTGGGSTSMRVLSDSLYTRIIVAGGGGGADSDYTRTNNGGYGGGTNGGNGSYGGSVRNQGGGTQIESSPGPKGSGSGATAGCFGKGASSVYNGRCNTGGGGGGGWYGGGSGGYGETTNPSSGGGGSGWIFTESTFNTWKSGDPSNESQFKIDKSLYLTDAITKAGNSSFPNPNGNGNETGHMNNGYAKITPI